MKVQAVVNFSSTINEHSSNIFPSEHVFSVAGTTISKDRAQLASDVANELVFLHDALPGVQNIMKHKMFKMCCIRW